MVVGRVEWWRPRASAGMLTLFICMTIICKYLHEPCGDGI